MKKKNFIIEGLEITDFAAEGKAVGRRDGKVIFVKNAVPGDVADVLVYRSKSSFAEAEAVKILQPSLRRTDSFCSHFGTCGGCKWQDMDYASQLEFKEKQVLDQITRIGKIQPAESNSIVGAGDTRFYRNKLEYTFADRRWLTREEIEKGDDIISREALGFHIPGKFDKILDIQKCWLQDELSNGLRLEVKRFAVQNNISFFNLHSQEGALRNMIIRNTTLGEWMVLMVFAAPLDDQLESLLQQIQNAFPQVSSIMYVINRKKNDTIHDLPVHLFHGRDHIMEQLGDVKYRISAKSFFQTNSEQAKKLYDITKTYAGLAGNELVYDLYTGTGSIACYIAADAKHVVGIEYVNEAVLDAHQNASLNNIRNVDFFAGDMKDVLNDQFIATHGKPDVIITDPPRAGMHEDVVKKILEIGPERIVYVSCNPATQARDLALMSGSYSLEKIQPVDMFPHTHHVENVALLVRT